jgi:hypothetical protein
MSVENRQIEKKIPTNLERTKGGNEIREHMGNRPGAFD